MTPNKTVFITGASRGIGRAIAIRFAAAGYQLALCCRQNTQLLVLFSLAIPATTVSWRP